VIFKNFAQQEFELLPVRIYYLTFYMSVLFRLE